MLVIYCMITFTDFVSDTLVQYHFGTCFLLTFCVIVLLNFIVRGYSAVDGLRHKRRMAYLKKIYDKQIKIDVTKQLFLRIQKRTDESIESSKSSETQKSRESEESSESQEINEESKY